MFALNKIFTENFPCITLFTYLYVFLPAILLSTKPVSYLLLEQRWIEDLASMAQSAKPISSPVPVDWYPSLAVLMLAVGLVITASFFIYEATSSKKNRSLAKELVTGAMASVFLGFGSLFLLLASGVYGFIYTNKQTNKQSGGVEERRRR
ncbi:hypothetical protein QVD17_03400 [Tagetes erecta]|uniref:Dolichyl-diphosphooligosaccharide-protein glycosyltransferase subunit OST5 n=1 Tax=Tagetes erecta TaxID=13708 RepID=A0AAD8LEH6_TARER|nr:hypothetical protein QVD17_03400 [Tagetes erecta]